MAQVVQCLPHKHEFKPQYRGEEGLGTLLTNLNCVISKTNVHIQFEMLTSHLRKP
jgi:hypothetical protein